MIRCVAVAVLLVAAGAAYRSGAVESTNRELVESGWSAYLKGDLDEAQGIWEKVASAAKAARDDDREAEAWVLISQVEERRGHLDRATSLVEGALALAPRSSSHREAFEDRLVDLYIRSDHATEAEGILLEKSVRELSSIELAKRSRARALQRLGTLYAGRELDDEAESAYMRALELVDAVGPEAPAVLESLTRLYESQGRFAKASDLCARRMEVAVKIWGKTAPAGDVARDCARIYFAANRREEGESALASARALEATPHPRQDGDAILLGPLDAPNE